MPDSSQQIAARYYFPSNGPPQRDRLITFGREVTAHAAAEEAENIALVPWLQNAHTHLELSGFEQPLGNPAHGFPAWIRDVIAWRRAQSGSPEELATARTAAIERGLCESLAAGVRTIHDITSPLWQPSAYQLPGTVPLIYQELLGLSTARADEIFAVAEEALNAPPEQRPAGLSPHAPYTIGIELLDRLAQLSAARRVPLAMHLAESLDERELLSAHSGAFHTLLNDIGAWDPAALPRGISILDYLQVLAKAHSALIVHGNYLHDDELDFIAENPQLAVVYCPRTHAYFGHARYPLVEMLQRGIKVQIGTDSRASNPDLNIWNELRTIADRYPELALDTILALAFDPSLKLGEAGFLTPGNPASFLVISLPEEDTTDPYELLLDARSVVREAYWHGQRIAVS
ncbi:MAG TPA: amidohydrolase family protein [Pirellulaceae bacterium]|nr:amidohydrolase family protein [Pirellulaceae bacterium]